MARGGLVPGLIGRCRALRNGIEVARPRAFVGVIPDVRRRGRERCPRASDRPATQNSERGRQRGDLGAQPERASRGVVAAPAPKYQRAGTGPRALNGHKRITESKHASVNRLPLALYVFGHNRVDLRHVLLNKKGNRRRATTRCWDRPLGIRGVK